MRTRGQQRAMVAKSATAVVKATAGTGDGPGDLAAAMEAGEQVKTLEDLRVEEVSIVTNGANLRPFLIVKSSAGLVDVQKTLMAIPGITECADKLGALGAVLTLIANAERPSEVQAILDALTPVVEKVGNLAGSNEASTTSDLDELLGLDHLDARIAMAETKLAGMKQRRAKTAEIDEVEQRLRSLRLAKSTIVAKLDPSVQQAMALMQQAMQLLQRASGGAEEGGGMSPEQAAAAAAAQAQLAATSAPPQQKSEAPTTTATVEQVAAAAEPVAKARPALPASHPEDESTQVAKSDNIVASRKSPRSLSWLM